MNQSHPNRRSIVLAGAVTGLMLAAPALRAQLRPEKTKITLAVGGKAAFYYLPLTIAEQLGYFRAEGLDVEINDFAGGSHAVQAAAEGAADVVSGAYEHTIDRLSRGQKFQAFVLQGRAPAISMGVSIKTVPRYRSLADLKGRKIGISAPGSSTNMVARLILSRAGLRPEDVHFVGIGSSASALLAFHGGQVDAICNVDPVMTMLEQRGELRIIADTRTIKGTLEVFGGAMPAGCLYAPLEFVQQNPKTVQALANAIVHSLKWLQTAGPRDIIRTVPESHLLGDRALYLASFNKVREAFSTDGLIPEEGPRTALRMLASFDPAIKVDQIDLAKTYTNVFARKAKDRFEA